MCYMFIKFGVLEVLILFENLLLSCKIEVMFESKFCWCLRLWKLYNRKEMLFFGVMVLNFVVEYSVMFKGWLVLFKWVYFNLVIFIFFVVLFNVFLFFVMISIFCVCLRIVWRICMRASTGFVFVLILNCKNLVSGVGMMGGLIMCLFVLCMIRFFYFIGRDFVFWFSFGKMTRFKATAWGSLKLSVLFNKNVDFVWRIFFWIVEESVLIFVLFC